MRLQDIKQSQAPFGGVAVLLSGDLQQLGPVKGRFIFEKPIQEQYHPRFHSDPLWEKFEFFSLTTNHRQGEDKDYANMLNRIRIGERSLNDLAQLGSRIGRKIPKESVMAY